jgi:predicted ArsR family transcriptional regulator
VVSGEGLTSAKRRIVDALKRQPCSAPELAARFGLTSEAVRQQLVDLADHGLVRSARRPAAGAGRPAVEWSLTELALDLFPDRHADLTVSLIQAIRVAAGEEGLDRVIAQRSAEQLGEYRRRMEASRDRVDALASLRNEEGYMAEVVDAADGDGRLLVEHHCPICDAAATCQGLCRSELQLFRDVLGPDHEVTREQHLLSGDERCVYRIRPAPRSTGSDPG